MRTFTYIDFLLNLVIDSLLKKQMNCKDKWQILVCIMSVISEP